MAIKLSQGFQITSKQPIDTRVVLTKQQMVEMNDSLMPEKYMAVCMDDGQLYVYDKLAEASTETGKFKPAGMSADDADVTNMLDEVFG